MDVFDLDTSLIDEYQRFARSFTRIRSAELQQKVNVLYADRRFWPDPLLQLNPHYQEAGTVRSLVGPGGLVPECAQFFRLGGPAAGGGDDSLRLHRHQAQAIGLGLGGKSYVVTTGTGSGKSLCFFIPIVDAVVKAKRAGEGPRTRAIVVYPMNALANSQQEELRKFLGSGAGGLQVSFGRYTGQETPEEREAIRKNPPDILLTNFMMLELLMTRQSELDRQVIANCRGLKFIVLDELHTYRGRQGADVAMLMRRLRARVGDPTQPPVCVGTSATMASEGNEMERNRAVAAVASKLFGVPISLDAVITETLRRVTDPHRSAGEGLPDLAEAVTKAANGDPYRGKSNADLGHDSLAIWVETRLGLKHVDHKPQRAEPQSLETASKTLAADCKEPAVACESALRRALLAFSLPEKDRDCAGGGDSPLFAFKLHQFISGAGRLYTTLDQAGQRTVTFDGQVFDPENPTKRLYAAHFCRNCGQEHHPVTAFGGTGAMRFEKREIDDVPANDDEADEGEGRRWGFLMPEPVDGDEFDFDGSDESYPDAWLEETRRGEVRLKATYRKTRAEPVNVLPEGLEGVGGRRSWFMPGKFKFCPACGDHHSDSTRDINRLASLSAEGRSSATTILLASILRWMNEPAHGVSARTRKLLAFTDNRQDAALQAGHFNDFLFVALLRGAILAALDQAGEEGLAPDAAGQAIQRMLGFVAANLGRRPEWLVEPDLKGAGLVNAERSLRESLAHRFWVDQRRGWRFTNPNLEQLGLVEVRYLAIEDLVRDDAQFERSAMLRAAAPAERLQALKALLDLMRKGLAVDGEALERESVERLAARMRGVIKAPWSVEEERIRSAPVFMSQPPSRRDMTLRDEALVLRGSPSSAIGRILRDISFGGTKPRGAQITEIVEGLLAAAVTYGLATQAVSPVGGEGWRLLPQGMSFVRADVEAPERDNRFFRALYEEIGGMLRAGGSALFGFEGREHTAQVDGDLRELREARFRYGSDDEKFLKESAERLRELGEDSRFLPTLFCSPTMELGVDISSMNVVYLRNMPPTAANYAQRSGRAGRSGQAALIVSYCAAQSPHDQYFFQRPAAMVAGVVVPPSIDLANPELVESHLQAEWLAASGINLDKSIARNLEMTAAGKPLLPALREQAGSGETREAASARVAAILSVLEGDYGGVPPSWFDSVESHTERVVVAAPLRFADAFNRWRDLLAAAERQISDATATLADYSISPPERRAAEERQRNGNIQLRLLLRGSEGQGSDFYSYRYLATEGFLPGYNFPRLPLMAFIPGGQGGKGERYLQRPRFLAISEFGPGSLVYHEGRAFRVDRALLREAGGGADGRLPTFHTSLCPACGAGHDSEPPEQCHVCGTALGGAHLTRDLYRIDNVGTRQVERITANDEERRRQGFDLQTSFSFYNIGDVRRRTVGSELGDLLSLTFAPAVLIRRINRGLRRRQDQSNVGFLISPRTGYWAGTAATDDEGAGGDDPRAIKQRIVPVVEDRKNALLARFDLAWLAGLGDEADAVTATLQHAMARGIEAVYQLEEGEVLVEAVPSRQDRRALLFYEAAEGGAGALSRLVDEPEALAQVAREALEIMHFEPASIDAARERGASALTEAEPARCVASCYRCLLSYFNQPDQELIDRRKQAVREFLVALASARLRDDGTGGGGPAPYDGCPPADREPFVVDGHQVAAMWRTARVAADESASAPPWLAQRLSAQGIDLVLLPDDQAARQAGIARLAGLLSAAT